MNSNWKLLPASLLVAVLALAGCGGGSDEPTGPTDAERAAMMEMQEAADAIEAANAAAMALSNASDDAAVTDAEGLIATAKDEIGDLPAADQAAQLAMLSGAESIVMAQRGRLTAEAEAAAAKSAEERLKAEQEAERMRQEAEEARMAAAAMAATAAKLYAGISAPMGDANSPAATDRAAAYNNAGTPADSTADSHILVTIGDGTNTPTAVALSEDKKTMVAANHGWAGKRFTAEPDGDGMYEAMVYSNVGSPSQGDKFGQIGVTTGATGYEYGLDASGNLVADGGGAFTWVANRIASSRFDHSAGTKEFELGTNDVYVSISGSYHGVSGEYRCTPAASSTCAVQIAANGFNLGGTADADNAFTAGGGTWTFKPSNTEARVTDMPDTIYASYGWWIHKSEDDGTYTASAFADIKGAVPDAAGLDTLEGTGTYMGGAAGKYALSSSTGGTNDAGHFTARATLEADFSDNSITGTIDSFMGADGNSRDWSVELKKAAIAAEGGISRAEANDTVWT
ncbi:MAG: hypothetical protein F4109_01600, partial [Gammaproteobacteria bacterium]|nr:hypothetical protein [Gammaproteobacteria bacterium]